MIDEAKNIHLRIRKALDIYNVFKRLEKQGYKVDITEDNDTYIRNESYNTYYKNPVMVATIKKGNIIVDTYFINLTKEERKEENKYGKDFKQCSICTRY